MENVDIKTLIYFLIAIVWFIFSVFRKSQKRTAEPAPAEEAKKEEDQVDIKTLLEEILTGTTKEKEKKREIISTEIPASPEEKKEKIKQLFHPVASIKPNTISTPKKTPTTSSIQAEKKRIFEMEDEIQQEHEFLSDFDSEKAIIYSEILKRPHY